MRKRLECLELTSLISAMTVCFVFLYQIRIDLSFSICIIIKD